jgi:hypothetical protein
MAQPDLKLIAKLVKQHRNEVSCLTAGEHADARKAASPVDISMGDVMDVLTDLADLCLEQGWDFHALAGQVPAGPGR